MCAFSGVITLLYRVEYQRERQDALDRAKEHALAEMARAARKIDDSLARAAEVNRALVERLEQGPQPPETLRAWIADTMDEYPQFFGVGVAYAPYGYPYAEAPMRLFAPYYARVSGVLDWADIDYDYASGGQPWFEKTMVEGRPVWHEPRYGQKSRTRLASYTAPFFHRNLDGFDGAEPSGVVLTTLSMAYYRALLHELELGKYGYGFVISRTGLFVAHPDQSYVDSGKIITELENPVLEEIWQRAQTSKAGHFARQDPYSGRSAWLLYQSIAHSGWTLVLVFSRGDVDDSVYPRGRIVIFISGVVFALSAGVLAFLLLPWRGRAMQRLLAFYATAVLLSAVASILCTSRAFVPELEHDVVELADPAVATEQVLKLAERRAIRDDEEKGPPIIIPTGVFVSSIRFSDANDVEVSGYIWQRYDSAAGTEIVRGIVLPEAVSLDMELDFQSDEDDFIRWKFSATLRQRFDYRYYPFDDKTVWVRMQPKDRSSRVLLVPDYSSYLFAASQFMPGLDPGIVTSELAPVKTVFCARILRLDTNLGEERTPTTAQPELFFNMLFRRRYAQSVINYFVPMLVVTLLVFGVLLSTSIDDARSALFGFSFFNVLQICASLFFVISVAHIDLRTKVPQDICYAELLYFLMYPMILWLALHTMTVVECADPDRARAINQTARRYFWPVVSALVFILTVWIFRDIL